MKASRKKIIALIIVWLIGVTNPAIVESETRDKELNLYARSAVLMNAETGRILYGKNADEKMAMASTTKIMTLIVALEEGELSKKAVVSEYAAGMPKVHLGMKVGEEYVLKDLLYSLMLESHNDSAVVIAETIGGSVEGFAKKMNEKAKEIGCKKTHFVTPNGLDDAKHYSTAKDMAKILAYAVTAFPQKDAFLEITRTKEYRIGNKTCYNHNRLLEMMDGAITGKTGFTAKAGYCYVGAVKKGEVTYVFSLLACGWPNNKGYKWKDSKTLLAYGESEYYPVYEEEVERFREETSKLPDKIPVIKGKKKYVPVHIVSKAKMKSPYLLLKKGEKIRICTKLSKTITAPVKKGSKVGEILFVFQNGRDRIFMQKDIVTDSEVKKTKYYDGILDWIGKHSKKLIR
ncbi:MAG: D-alanyl-D-alanine carboxypeptidase [Lachnospiraceae bacterium]|nr:D-alanyl-D-alanine carboxypeptidase [Lachnospiraceae bacterium]